MGVTKDTTVVASSAVSTSFLERHSLHRINGNFYATYFDGSNIRFYESTNNGTSWSLQVTRSSVNAVPLYFSYAVDTSRNNLAVLVGTNSYTSGKDFVADTQLIIYSTGSNSVVEDSVVKTVIVSAGQARCAIDYNSGNDNYYAVYRGDDTSSMGAVNAASYLGYRSAATSSSWTLGVDMGAAVVGSDGVAWGVVVDPGSNDKIHCFYQTGTTYYGRTYSRSGGTFATAVTTSNYAQSYWAITPGDDGTVTKLMYHWSGTTNAFRWMTTNSSRNIVSDNTGYPTRVLSPDVDYLYYTNHIFNPDDSSHYAYARGRTDLATDEQGFDLYHGTAWGDISTFDSNGKIARYKAYSSNAVYLYPIPGGVTWSDSGTRKFSFLYFDDTPNDLKYLELTSDVSSGPTQNTRSYSTDAIATKPKAEYNADAIAIDSGNTVWYPPTSDSLTTGWLVSPSGSVYAAIDEYPYSDSDYTYNNNPLGTIQYLQMGFNSSGFKATINKFYVGASWLFRITESWADSENYDGNNFWFNTKVSGGVSLRSASVVPNHHNSTYWSYRIPLEPWDLYDDVQNYGGSSWLYEVYSRTGFLQYQGFANVSQFGIVVISKVYVPGAPTWKMPRGYPGPVYAQGYYWYIARDGDTLWLMRSASPTSGQNVNNWTAVYLVANSSFYDNLGDFAGDVMSASLSTDGTSLWIGVKHKTYRKYDGTTFETDDGYNIATSTFRYNASTDTVTWVGYQPSWAGAIYLSSEDVDLDNTYKDHDVAGTIAVGSNGFWMQVQSDTQVYGIYVQNSASTGAYVRQYSGSAFDSHFICAHLNSGETWMGFGIKIGGTSGIGVPVVRSGSGASGSNNFYGSFTVDDWKPGMRGCLNADRSNKVFFPAARVSGGVRVATFTASATPTISVETVSTRTAYKVAYIHRNTLAAVPVGTRTWVFWLDAANDDVYGAYQDTGSSWTEYGLIITGGVGWTNLDATYLGNNTIGLMVATDSGVPVYYEFESILTKTYATDALVYKTSVKTYDTDAIATQAVAGVTRAYGADAIAVAKVIQSYNTDAVAIAKVQTSYQTDAVVSQVYVVNPSIGMGLDSSASPETEAPPPPTLYPYSVGRTARSGRSSAGGLFRKRRNWRLD